MDVGLPHGPSVAPVRSGLYLPQAHALNQATRSSWWTSYSLTKTRSPFEIFLVPTAIRSVCYNAHCSSTDYKVTSLVFHRKSWSISHYSSGYIYEYTYPPDAISTRSWHGMSRTLSCWKRIRHASSGSETPLEKFLASSAISCASDGPARCHLSVAILGAMRDKEERGPG